MPNKRANAPAPNAPSKKAKATAPSTKHEPQARPSMLRLALLFAALPGGMEAHVSPPPMPGMARGNRTKMYLRNYPSPHSKAHGGYVTKKGHATDTTTRLKARAVATSMPAGQHVVWGQMYDFYGDVYDGPHAFKFNGTSADFKPGKHFVEKLSDPDKKRFIDAKIDVLKSLMVDAIVMHGHTGADCDIAGADALKYWPVWLEQARVLAVKEASEILGYDVTYDIARPPEELLAKAGNAVLKKGEKAPTVKPHEVQHECATLTYMSLYHRARVDAATAWIHRHLLGGRDVDYFKAISPMYGELSDEERKKERAGAGLQGDDIGRFDELRAMVSRSPTLQAEYDALVKKGLAALSELGALACLNDTDTARFNTLHAMASRGTKLQDEYDALLKKAFAARSELGALACLNDTDTARFNTLHAMASRGTKLQDEYDALLKKARAARSELGGSNGARALGGMGGGAREGSGGAKGDVKKLTQATAEAEGLCWGFCHGCSIPRRGAVTATKKPALLKLPCSAIFKKRNQCGQCKKDFKPKPPA